MFEPVLPGLALRAASGIGSPNPTRGSKSYENSRPGRSSAALGLEASSMSSRSRTAVRRSVNWAAKSAAATSSNEASPASRSCVAVVPPTVDLLAYQLHDEGAALRFNSGGFQVVKPASSPPTRPRTLGKDFCPGAPAVRSPLGLGQIEAGLGPETSKPAQGHEPVRAARPMPAQRFEPYFVDHSAQDGDGHNRVVGVAQDRDEVGNEVNGQGQVGHQQAQPDPDAAGKGDVGGQIFEQPDQVGQDPK